MNIENIEGIEMLNIEPITTAIIVKILLCLFIFIFIFSMFFLIITYITEGFQTPYGTYIIISIFIGIAITSLFFVIFNKYDSNQYYKYTIRFVDKVDMNELLQNYKIIDINKDNTIIITDDKQYNNIHY